MNARRNTLRSHKASAQSSAIAPQHKAAEIPSDVQTLQSESPDSHTILNSVLNRVKSLDPVAQVLALHDALIEHAMRDATVTEALASALLERAFEPGHAPAPKHGHDSPPNSLTESGTSQHKTTSQALHPVLQARPAASNPPSREEQYRALREKYGLAASDTGDSLSQFWKNSTKSVTRFARAAIGAFGGTSPAVREQARNLAREALVGTWAMLPDSIRKAATSARGLDLGDACARLLAMPVDTNGVHHAGACAWAVEECEPRHLPLMVPLLKSKAIAARVAAERAIFAFCYVLAAPRIPEWMTLALQGERTGEDAEFAVLPDASWKGWEWTTALSANERLAAAREADRALADALLAFDQHNRRAVLMSALAWFDPAIRISLNRNSSKHAEQHDSWNVLSVDEHPAQSSLAGMLRTSRWPLTRLRALQWLATEPRVSSRIARACTARLSATHSPQDHEALLNAAHLCHRPRRAEHLGKVIARGARSTTRANSASVQVQFTAISPETTDRLTPEARRMMGLWQSKIGIGAPLRERTLSVFLADPSPRVRMSLCRHGTSSLRFDSLFDSDTRVAHSALMAVVDDLHVRSGHTSTLNEDAARSLRLLSLSVDDSLRHAAEREMQGVGDAFADTAVGRLAAIRWLSENRTACIQSLRDALQTHSNTTANSLRLVRLLRLAPDVEESLLRLSILTSPEHSRVAAMAVSLLASVNSDATKRVLKSCLAHPDARVRANTIESLGRLDASLLANTIIEVKHDKHHRVCANAMRADMLIAISGKESTSSIANDISQHQHTEPKVANTIPVTWRDDLASLLTNDSVMHRLAGVWLATRTLPLLHSHVDRLAWAESSQRIAEMADFDSDTRVRRRAVACAALVEGATKFQWRGSVA